MIRTMLFADGSWFYKTFPQMRQAYGDPEFKLDYGLLPKLFREKLKEVVGMEVDMVRAHWFSSIPENFDLLDEDLVNSQRRFYSTLQDQYHYEVQLFPIDFRGQRIRYADRIEALGSAEAADEKCPQEKCVDIALATALLYYAAIPGAYDVATVLIGDRDYVPVLQQVRRLGKRVQIVGVKRHTARAFYEEGDPERLRDFDTLFLDDMLDSIRLDDQRRACKCSGCGRTFYTSYRPQRQDERLFCDECREKHKASYGRR